MPKAAKTVIDILAVLAGSATIWVLAPPVVLPGPRTDTSALLRLPIILAAILGYFLGHLAARLWAAKGGGRRVWIVGVSALMTASALWLFLSYGELRSSSVVPYGNLLIVKGDHVRKEAQDKIDALPPADRTRLPQGNDEALLKAFTGRYEEIWPSDGIARVRDAMWWRLLASLLLALAVVSFITNTLPDKPSKTIEGLKKLFLKWLGSKVEPKDAPPGTVKARPKKAASKAGAADATKPNSAHP